MLLKPVWPIVILLISLCGGIVACDGPPRPPAASSGAAVPPTRPSRPEPPAPNSVAPAVGQPPASAADNPVVQEPSSPVQAAVTRSHNCADFVDVYTAEALDAASNTRYTSSLTVELDNGWCVFRSNGIPNHTFNDAGGFRNRVQEQAQTFRVTADPQKNSRPTPLSLQYDNAILLNGVKVDLLAAGCYGVGDGKIGCFDMDTPWRYDPMSPNADFGTDSHHAHTQPDGTYHYHGNPQALFDDQDGRVPSPVIGFAADGFPIFGSYFDDNGTIRRAVSSYQLRAGTRPGGPGGRYDGTFIDDYEYIAGSGDLDECNGMMVDGVYGYYVTDSYPYMLGCFSGSPDDSFRKGR